MPGVCSHVFTSSDNITDVIWITPDFQVQLVNGLYRLCPSALSPFHSYSPHCAFVLVAFWCESTGTEPLLFGPICVEMKLCERLMWKALRLHHLLKFHSSHLKTELGWRQEGLEQQNNVFPHSSLIFCTAFRFLFQWGVQDHEEVSQHSSWVRWRHSLRCEALCLSQASQNHVALWPCW